MRSLPKQSIWHFAALAWCAAAVALEAPLQARGGAAGIVADARQAKPLSSQLLIPSNSWHVYETAASGAMALMLNIEGGHALNLHVFDLNWNWLQSYDDARAAEVLVSKPQRVFVIVENAHESAAVAYSLDIVKLKFR